MEMHARKILFIINPKSGSSDNTELQGIIAQSLEGHPVDYDTYYLSGDDDKMHIQELIRKYQPDIVCAAGGDGTVNLVASIIRNQPLTMGIIPIGSANGLAKELGISENPEEAIGLILSESPKPMDLVQINTDNFSLHLSDVGLNARIVSEFEKEGQRGFKGYVKHFLRELVKPKKSFKCEIQTDDRVFIHRSHMTVIANASKYRTGANLNPTGKMDDGLFEIVVFKSYRNWMWRSLIGAFTGTMHKQPHVETYVCKSATIKFKPPQDLQVDGESLGKVPHCTASIHKHALRIVVPSS